MPSYCYAIIRKKNLNVEESLVTADYTHSPREREKNMDGKDLKRGMKLHWNCKGVGGKDWAENQGEREKGLDVIFECLMTNDNMAHIYIDCEEGRNWCVPLETLSIAEQPEEEAVRIKLFIEEYDSLCRKHGFYIGACGCCDSPWVIDLPGELNEIELVYASDFEQIIFEKRRS